MFDVGALIFKIQTAGAQVFQRDMAQADQAIKKVEGSAKSAKPALDAQGKAQEDLGKKSADAAPKQRKQAEATEAQVQAAKTLSLALIAAGAAVTALVGLSVAKYTEFDAQMSNVRAATMATADEQRALADAALEAGADTAYSATEAAAAQEELAKAGQDTADIVGGSLTGALSLAAAGQLAVARSAEIMATTLKQYNLEAEDAGHVSDVLAAGAGKAQGSVDDLALALSYVGPVAAGLGISLEETGGALAYLASQGILGEKAGTGLRGVLMSLTAPSAIATRTMQEYGIEIFDAQGNMKSLAEVSQILKTRLGGLTEAERSAALGRIFGNEQITAARILYAGGAQAIDEWTAAVDDSGYAAEQAAIRQDNLAGDIEKLGGAFDTALIKTGSGANDVLREMVQSVTALVDWYGELPEPVQATALVIGVLTGAVLLASGAALSLTARFSELRVQLEKSNISMGKTAAIGGAVGLALAGVVTVVGLLAQRQAEARQRAESYADALKQGSDAVREFVAAELDLRQEAFGLEYDSAYEAAEKLGISIDLVTEAAEGSKPALVQLKEELAAGGIGSDEFKAKLDDLGLSLTDYSLLSTTVTQAVEKLNEAHDRGAASNERANEVAADGSEVSQSAAEAYLEAADGADELNSQLQQLIDQINEANGVGQDAISTNAEYQEALAGIAEQAAEMGVSLDQSTVAGSANASMLADVASKAMDAAAAQLEVDKQTMSGKEAADKYYATLQAQRQAFIDSALAAGYNADEVYALADQIFKLPSEKEIALLADTVPARTAINGVIADFQGRTITLRIGAQGQQTYSRDGQTFYQADGGNVRFFAGGGEHHVAQFARAGDWRVWAEPETGGEWYLPNSPAKRPRSLAIAQQMLNEWGYAIVPSGARAFADGSPESSPRTAPAPANAVFNLYDVDGVLIGTIRGEVAAAARDHSVALAAGSRKG